MIKIKKIFGIVFSAFLFVSLMANSPIQLLFAAAPTLTIGGGSVTAYKTYAQASFTLQNDGGSAITSYGAEYGLTNSYGQTYSEDTFYSGYFTGSPGSGDGQFNNPSGIAVDSSDNIYVVDTNNDRVQKFNSAGVYQSQFGTAGSGDGQFNNPSGIGIDSIGNIFVVDEGNHRVQKFNSAGVYQSQFGTFGIGDGQFNAPTGIDFDSLGNIFVLDHHRVQKFNSAGVYQSKFGTTGSGDGQFSFSSNGSGIAIDSQDNIYVADTDNSRVQKFNSAGVYQSQFGTLGFANGEFYEPVAIHIDDNDYIYVHDFGSRLQKFTTSGEFKMSFDESTGNRDRGGIYVDSQDNIFTSSYEGNIIHKISQRDLYASFSSLTCSTEYHYRFFATNSDGTSYSSDDTFTTLDCEPPILETKEVTSITKTSATIHALHTSDGASTPTVRGFEYGTTNSYGNSIDYSLFDSLSVQYFAGEFTNYNVGAATALSIDSSDNIYVVGKDVSSIQVYDNGAQPFLLFGWGVETGASQFETCTFGCFAGIAGSGNGQFNSPEGIDVDVSTGNIFVSDTGNNRMQVFDSDGNYLFQFGSSGSGQGQFNSPKGIAVFSGHLYVVDSGNNRIQKFTTGGTFVSEIGSLGSGVNQFNSPTGIIIDDNGLIYVSDTGNNRIKYVSLSFGTIGNVSFSEPSGWVSLASPTGITIDSDFNLYVSDSVNDHINYAVRETDNTYRFISSFGSTGSGNGQFDNPNGLVVSQNTGLLFVNDTGNNRVEYLSPFFSNEIAGLSCGTTYYYRPFATNSDGTGYGTEGTFTTSSCGGSTGSGGGGNNPTPGCTDPLAENYNSFADVDNGTCTYEADIWGCVNPFATNYNILATQSDGSCVFDDIIPGPTDVPGCRDSSALNYNPSATQDNGSCTYPTVLPDPNDIFGCTDSTALNFNSSATKNNGSCEYAPGEEPKDNNPGIGGGADLPSGTSKKIIPRAFEYVIRIFDKVPTPWLKILAEIALAVSIPLRLWNLIPAILGFRRKRRPWGTVYDSVTKQPLDPVYVTLKNILGKDIGTLITDLDGRYGFLTEKGDYTLSANKADYVFPSQKMAGQTKDELYDNLYFGESLHVQEDGEIINKNIPMDAVKFNWNEFEKTKNKKLMKFFSNTELALAKFATVLFIAGFTSSFILIFLEPRFWNYAILGLYVLILSLPLFGLKEKKPGFIFDKQTGFPMSFGIVSVFSAMLQKEIAHAVVGKTGKYFILVPKGKYYIKLKKKTGENTYEDIFTSDSFNVRSGYINKVIKI